MRTLYFDGSRLQVREHPTPQPEPSEALVRVLLAGICGTDLQLVHGYKGFEGVLGHEFVGEVVRCDADPARVGQRVVGEINLTCGACWACWHGRKTHCVRRRVLGLLGKDGCFAEFLTLPTANLHHVPDKLSNQQAVFCEPLAAALHAVSTVGDLDRPIAVVGDGRLGLLHVMALTAHGRPVTLFGKHPRKLALGHALGAEIASADSRLEPLFEVVIDATGSPQGAADSLARVRPGGRLILKTTTNQKTHLDLSRVVVDEITVQGSRCGPFGPALEAMATGLLDPRPMVDAVVPLEEAVGAFEPGWLRGKVKVLVEVG